MTPATYTAILPFVLLLLVFLIKLIACRPLSVLEVWRAAMEVPVDISIFGVSTLISFIIVVGSGGGLSQALFWLLLFIVLKVVSIVIWRQSITALERGGLRKTGLAAIALGTGLNFFITIMMAVFAVSLLVGKQHVSA
jgi:hypothetical protein